MPSGPACFGREDEVGACSERDRPGGGVGLEKCSLRISLTKAISCCIALVWVFRRSNYVRAISRLEFVIKKIHNYNLLKSEPGATIICSFSPSLLWGGGEFAFLVVVRHCCIKKFRLPRLLKNQI